MRGRQDCGATQRPRTSRPLHAHPKARLACVDVLLHQMGPATVAFLRRAAAWFIGQGIECQRVLGPIVSAFKSHVWEKACQTMDLKVKKIQALHSKGQRQGRAVQETLLEDGSDLQIDASRRCPMAQAGVTPQQRPVVLQA